MKKFIFYIASFSLLVSLSAGIYQTISFIQKGELADGIADFFISLLVGFIYYKLFKWYKNYRFKINNITSIHNNLTLKNHYGFTAKEFKEMKESLITNWSFKKTFIPSDNDVYWALCNSRIVHCHPDSQEYLKYKEIQEEILRTENKSISNKFSTTVKNNENNFLNDIDKQFGKEYLNAILEDGKTIKQHMLEDYKKQSYLFSEQAKSDFPKEIERQYKYIIQHMDNRSDKYLDVLPAEEFLLKTFLKNVSLVRKNYSINIERHSDGMIRINYNNCPTGQFNLRDDSNYVRFLRGLQVSDKYDVTFSEMLKATDSWVRYCKYQLKETRWIPRTKK